MIGKILIIDDEPNIQSSFSSLLTDEGHKPITAASAEAGLEVLAGQSFDLILLDLQLPGMSGIDLLRKIKDDPDSPVVLVISGQADIPMALEAVKLGAINFLEKPVPPEKLIADVNAALLLAAAQKQRQLMMTDMDDQYRIIGQSAAVKKMLATIDKVAPTDTTVLITGANGTGKELVATRLFLNSRRRDKPFVKVNCPGIPETLFESELFGHVKGAFTGAVKDYPGKFNLADSGTIFLDEIGDLPLPSQAKLLRVLETGEVETLGTETHKAVDVRVICATNRDLKALVADGKFRQDLYYRISVFNIETPPLSKRTDDIPLLVGAFLKKFDPSGKTKLAPESITCLTGQEFPGNVRQLKNIIERLTILHAGRIIVPEELGQTTENLASNSTPAAKETIENKSLTERLNQTEKRIIEQTLLECDGNISEAARMLQIDRANLSKKIKTYQIKKK